MCGIVGYVGKETAAPIILDGLSKLEYRGYDSAGMAVYDGNRIRIEKSMGRLKVLQEQTHDGATMPGTLGIGHTRWATHGAPSDVNSHPHYNSEETIAVVHNGIIENYQRQFNYPVEAYVKSRRDLERLGIKTYFCSNVCCAYRREIYDKLGGFKYPAIFNEDMVYAASVIKNGYKIAYVADACVYHSHNYTAKQQFMRNFDLGVSQANHPEVFSEVPSEGEGIRSVKATISYLKAEKQGKLIPKLIWHSGCKYMGYFLGKHYKRLPEKCIQAFTMNKEYWLYAKRKQDVANIDASKGYGKNKEENG